jgi:uncharacterized membrane protein
MEDLLRRLIDSTAEFHAFHREQTLTGGQTSITNVPHVGSDPHEGIPIQPLNMEKTMSITNSVVAIYETHAQAEHAIKELQESGVDMKSLSIAGKDTHTDEHVVGYYNAGDRMKHWGKVGAFWGGFWGLLFGSGLFLIPGLGPILVAGPLVAWIIAGLEGAVVVGGVSALGAGLVSIGIPKDSVLKYEVALKTDKYLLVVHGTEDAVDNAKNIIAGTEHSSYTVHGEKVFA